MKSKFFFFCIFLIAFQIFGQSRLSLEVGDEFNSVVEMEETITTDWSIYIIENKIQQTFKNNLKVSDDKYEKFRIVSEVIGYKIQTEQSGQKISFDSEKEEDLKGDWAEIYKENIGMKSDYFINKMTGEHDFLIDNTGYDGVFLVLPENLQVGQKWISNFDSERQTFEVQYEVIKIGEEEVTLTISGTTVTNLTLEQKFETANLSADFEGKLTVDRSTFLIKKTRQTIKRSDSLEVNEKVITSDIKINLKRVIKPKL